MTQCILCRHSDLETVFQNRTGVSVTSDTKIIQQNFRLLQCKQCGHIQKQPDEQWQKGIEQIYQNYDPYYLSEGQEESYQQSALDLDARSDWIFQQIQPKLSAHTKWLDIGAGNGAFIGTVANYRPQDAFYAQDLHNQHEPVLQKIPGFKQFFLGDLEQINQTFDVISLVHVLEHVLNPLEFIKAITPLMHEQTLLVIQVPNIEGNHHDIFTYDHVSHFFPQRLEAFLNICFQQVSYTPFKYAKEMLFVCQTPKTTIQTETPRFYPSTLQWQHLERSLQQVQQFIEQSTPVYVFGTTPPSLFWGRLLKQSLVAYIDDNPLKQNQTLDQRPIHNRQQILHKPHPILIPLGTELSKAIVQKAPHFDWIIL